MSERRDSRGFRITQRRRFRHVNAGLTQRQVERLGRLAHERKTSRAAMIRQAVEEFLGRAA